MTPAELDARREALAFALPAIVADWDNDRIDNFGAADMILSLIDVAREPAGAGLREAIESDRIEVIDAYGSWDESRDTYSRWVKVDDVLALATAEPGLDVERLRWAKWISEVGDTWPIVAQGDWACAECRPTSDLIEPGWRCVIHEARAALSDPKP